MEKESVETLKKILYRLDQLIALLKASSSKTLEEFKKQIEKDKVSSKILECTRDPTSYSELSKKVAEEMGVAEITVRKKISTLKRLGFLIATRRGREVYYENSGLFE